MRYFTISHWIAQAQFSLHELLIQVNAATKISAKGVEEPIWTNSANITGLVTNSSTNYCGKNI